VVWGGIVFAKFSLAFFCPVGQKNKSKNNSAFVLKVELEDDSPTMTSAQKPPKERARGESDDQREASFSFRKCRRHKTLFYGQACFFVPCRPLGRLANTFGVWGEAPLRLICYWGKKAVRAELYRRLSFFTFFILCEPP
jgi:hypothetical protein